MGVDLAYLLGDFALIGLVIAVFALTGWRPGRAWVDARRGLLSFALVDGFFMWEDATAHAIAGTAPAALWPAAALLVAFAAWARSGAGGGLRGAWRPSPRACALVAMPLAFALIALGAC